MREPYKDFFVSINDASILQSQIDRLYYTPLAKNIIDGLNVRLQFKQLLYVDSIPKNKKLKKVCVEKLKDIIDVRKESMSNSLKLAEIFVEYKDYSFAMKILEPWVEHPDVSEDLLLSYVSLCSQDEMRMHTIKFNYAMSRIHEINPKLFCRLLSGDNFSIRVFENQFIKGGYCKYCTN